MDELMDERHRGMAECDDDENPEQEFVAVAREFLQCGIRRD